MDPLSIATGIITLATVVSEGLRRARTLREAPAEIAALADEVTALHIVVQEIVKVIQEWSLFKKDDVISPGPTENLSTILSRAQAKLLELDSILNRVLVEDGKTKKLEFARFAWLRHKSKAESLLKDFASIQLSLSNVLEAANSVKLSRIHLRLEEMTILDRSASRNTTDTDSSNARKHKTQGGSNHVENGKLCVARTDRIEAFKCESDGMSVIPTTQILYKSGHDGVECRTRLPMQDGGTLAVLASADQSSVIQIKASRSSCPRWCSCICHKPSRFNSPSLLNEIVGAMSIGYSGVPFFSSPCSEKRCRPRQSSSAHITYQFPSWMMARAVSMLVSSKMAGPELQLRTLRIIPQNSDVFRLAITGDVDGMRSMFKDGLASIYDIDDRRWSLFHKAFLIGQGNVCKFLLEQGADPSLEASNGSNAVERAWHFDRTNARLGGHDQIISEIFQVIDVEELAEAQQYSTIHKIVLGLSKLDLETQLQHSTATIDDVDTRRRSPLWWASARGDHVSVSILLQYGACVHDATASDSHSALHVAQTSEVVKLLLESGVDVNCRDSSGRTPLHCCAYRGAPRGGSVKLFESLIEGGAEINAQSSAGHTALHYAAMYGFVDHMPLLLDRGALVDSRKPNGSTPLLDAVGCSQPRAVRYLLRHGADPNARTNEDRTILHTAAFRSDAATMKALAAAHLQNLAADAKDRFGMTPQQCFDSRLDKTETLADVFGEMLKSVQDPLADDASSFKSDSEDSDAFEDAVEVAD